VSTARATPVPTDDAKARAQRSTKTAGTTRARKPNREATEQALMDAALRLLERDGVLAGLNMQEVADEAGVNRGLIHHYFGTRGALLRAALARAAQTAAPRFEERRAIAPLRKGTEHFYASLEDQTFARLTALLALDGDDSFDPVPLAQERLQDLEREKQQGRFEADVDGEALLVVWESVLYGYSLIRNAASRELEVPTAEMDARVLALVGRLMQSLRQEPRVAKATRRRASS
jgi:AcrR family transcriptional regulator